MVNIGYSGNSMDSEDDQSIGRLRRSLYCFVQKRVYAKMDLFHQENDDEPLDLRGSPFLDKRASHMKQLDGLQSFLRVLVIL